MVREGSQRRAATVNVGARRARRQGKQLSRIAAPVTTAQASPARSDRRSRCGRSRWLNPSLPHAWVASRGAGLLCVAALLAALLMLPQRPVHAQSATPAPPAAEATPELPRRVVIRFLTEADFPPFNFYDEDGALTGFNVDLARSLCLELSATCDIKVAPWDELLSALKKGDTDAVVAGHAVSGKWLADIDFTERYFTFPGRFAGWRQDAFAAVTPEGLEGKRIAVPRGTPHEAYLKTFFRDSGIIVVDNSDRAREALVDKKVDLLFDDGVSLAFWLNGTNSKSCCEFKGGPFLEPRFFGDGMAIAVPRKDPQMRKLLNAALKRVRESGRLDELVQRYFPFRIY